MFWGKGHSLPHGAFVVITIFLSAFHGGLWEHASVPLLLGSPQTGGGLKTRGWSAPVADLSFQGVRHLISVTLHQTLLPYFELLVSDGEWKSLGDFQAISEKTGGQWLVISPTGVPLLNAVQGDLTMKCQLLNHLP